MSRSTRNAIFLHRTDAVCGRRTRPVSHADAPRIHRVQVKQDPEDKGVAVDKVTEAVLRGQTLKTVAGSASPPVLRHRRLLPECDSNYNNCEKQEGRPS